MDGLRVIYRERQRVRASLLIAQDYGWLEGPTAGAYYCTQIARLRTALKANLDRISIKRKQFPEIRKRQGARHRLLTMIATCVFRHAEIWALVSSLNSFSTEITHAFLIQGAK